MKRRLISLIVVFVAIPCDAGFHFGLGKAAAKKSKEVIDCARYPQDNSCKKSGNQGSSGNSTGPLCSTMPSNSNIVFSVLPKDWSDISHIVGFGTHGSSHPEGVTKLYLYSWNVSSATVYAPISGKIELIRPRSSQDYQLYLCYSKEVYVLFDHMTAVYVTEGQDVIAGQAIGSSGISALDFNVIHATATNSFPSSWETYAYEHNHAVCPVHYFTETLRTEFLERWNTTYYPKLFTEFLPESCEPVYCQNINDNQPGQLRGAWFTHQTTDSEHMLLMAFTQCAGTGTYANKMRLRMAQQVGGAGVTYYYDLSDDVDQGNNEHCVNLGSNRFMRYKLIGLEQLTVQIQTNSCPSGFSSSARNYDRAFDPAYYPPH